MNGSRISADWLASDEAQAVCAMLTKAGYQAYFVGGCVRNTLMGAPVSDLDIATDARPDVVIALAQSAGFKPIPTGIEHGTVTVVINTIAFEITTFRRDVETDGRRAIVAFSDKVDDDARRRDFTMNALYVSASGELIDPLGGLEDLRTRTVRFIEDPETRIREDYLRILRFFRFYAWYGDQDAGIDADGLAACADNIDGLASLSNERIGHEIRKLLLAPDPGPAVASMEASGVLNALLPGVSARALPVMIHLEQGKNIAPNFVRRLAAFGGDNLDERLRLTKSETRDLVRLREATGNAGELGYRLGADLAVSALLLRAASLGVWIEDSEIDAARNGAAKVFPITAADLMPDLSGPALGAALKRLEDEWVASGFSLSRKSLLQRV